MHTGCAEVHRGVLDPGVLDPFATRLVPPFFYDSRQIEDWLGHDVVASARDFAYAVSDLRWEGSVLSGKVQGRQRRSYVVYVLFLEDIDGLDIEGTCSCSMEFDCEHVAALLIASCKQMPASGAGASVALVKWLEAFRARRIVARGDSALKPASHVIAYVLAWSTYHLRHEIQLYKSRLNGDGTLRDLGQPWSNVEAALVRPPKFVTNEDLMILSGLRLERAPTASGFVLQGASGAALLNRILATGRAFTQARADGVPEGSLVALRVGAARNAQIAWQTQADQRLHPTLKIEPPATSAIVSINPAWYIDSNPSDSNPSDANPINTTPGITTRGGTTSGDPPRGLARTCEAGPLNLPCSAEALADYLSMPAIDPGEASLVEAVLREVAPELPPPPAQNAPALHVIESEPIPVLTLNTLRVFAWGWHDQGLHDEAVDFATVRFDYAGVDIDAMSTATLHRDAQGEVVLIQRNHNAEQARMRELRNIGMVKVSPTRFHGPRPFPEGMHVLKKATDSWPVFVRTGLAALRERGWRVVMAGDFRHNVIEIDEIEGSVLPAGEGWFELEMGIAVGDRMVRLEPLLSDLFGRDKRWLSGRLDQIGDEETIDLKTDRGERLRLRADRLKPVVRVLIDLFDSLGLGQGPLRVSVWDAGRLHAIEDLGRWQFHGDASIRQLAQRLQGGSGVRPAPVPKGLCAELRPYQHQGLSWMQFLREEGLCGILADDMGLGKTVQTLAHILAEKEAARLDRPALIVVPTTLVHNWREEARRFTPGLRVLDLQGPQRKERFDRIGEHDLVLTTYPLLWRDQAALAEHEYHLLILDEAQYVKNAATKAATTIRELQARHRLCLTGTPLENHLGELWAQFDFLLPGFLGTQKEFAQRWRNPIERGGDIVRRELLARRIRPFLLRRRKDEVAKELPPKTTIIRTVNLQGGQRDLYETVRAAMQEKVREAIQARGLARSQLIVLDALLKLRQVCCDPRLVNLSKTTRVKHSAQESAKLELLLEMLPEMIEEGRRILLFSQFTSMLSLIAAALDRTNISYSMLTGDTNDRVKPVQRFSRGEVPLMLISLKAGGVGLNLTAADTVIHYDFWWNPAVENQATDRAHRLGQDKPVFVYKLIVAGSIEEKIVTMQERKAALADAILSDDNASAAKFSDEDLQALFEPIPGVATGSGA